MTTDATFAVSADPIAVAVRSIHAIADGHLVVVGSTMNGRHSAPFALYADAGAVDTVFPATNRTFAMTQSHWFRIESGRIVEHWANRDDLGMAKQLGWIPPAPAYLFRMVMATRHAKRSAGGQEADRRV